MPVHSPRATSTSRSAAPRRLILTLAAGLTAGCGGEQATTAVVAPAVANVRSHPSISICHVGDAGWKLLEVSQHALGGHEGHGDYVARLEVDGTGNGDDHVHFTTVTSALAWARSGRLARGEVESAGCRITIVVAAGVRPGSTAPSMDPAYERFPL